MALAHYDPNAIVKRRDPHEPPPRVWSEEERANFRKSGFYKKLQEHALVVHDYQKQRDDARTRSDPEFAPRDDDFDADPVKPFDASVNYYKILGVDDLATAADIRKAWKKLVLVYHPDKIKQSGTDMSEKKARETFERISHSYEVLTDRPTRRQYDRAARDGDRANGEVFDWAKKRRKKKKDWVPPPVFGSAAEPSKKPKKVPGKPRDATVVVDFNALDAGCVRKFAVKRRYLSKEKKMTSSTKEYAIPVRPGEMSAKTWVFEGEGDSDATTLAGPVRFFLAIKPHATLIRKGCHCTSDAVVDVVAGRRFFALVETLSGRRAVALCGTAPDFGGRTGLVEVRVPSEGLPVLGMKRGERGWLAIKLKVTPGPVHDRVRRNRAAMEKAWETQAERVHRQIDLKQGDLLRDDFGVGMAKISVSTAHAPRSEAVDIAAASLAFFGEHLAQPGGPRSDRWRRFAYYFFWLAPSFFFGRCWLRVTPRWRPTPTPGAAGRRARAAATRGLGAGPAAPRGTPRARGGGAERSTRYYKPVISVSDDEDEGDDGDAISQRIKRRHREAKAERRRAAAEAARARPRPTATAAAATRRASDDDDDRPSAREPLDLPSRDAIINNRRAASSASARARQPQGWPS
ncbi:hypothetical protein JL720_10643 [Aureococcus anophagefferens]|nr:hypothetical protein JL720_10643 [Aureococcus anophagefferens]